MAGTWEEFSSPSRTYTGLDIVALQIWRAARANGSTSDLREFAAIKAPPVSAGDPAAEISVEAVQRAPLSHVAGSHVVSLMHAVSRLQTNYLDKVLMPLRLTYIQCSLILMLSGHEDSGLAQTELARAMDLGRSTTCGLVDRLEAKGYLVRQGDTEDRRTKRVALTESGRNVVSTIKAKFAEANLKMFCEDLSEVETFLRRARSQLLEMGAAPQ